MLIPDAIGALLGAGTVTGAVTAPMWLRSRLRAKEALASAKDERWLVEELLPRATGLFGSGEHIEKVLDLTRQSSAGGSVTAERQRAAICAVLRPLQDRIDRLDSSSKSAQSAAVRLRDEVLPTAWKLLREGDSVDEVLAALLPSDGHHAATDQVHTDILRQVLETVDAGEAALDSGRRASVNLGRRLEGDLNQVLSALREAERAFEEDDAVFEFLENWDHQVSQALRQATKIAVIGDQLPGRQYHRPYPVYQVVNGALSRIGDYRRVTMGATADAWIAAPAVETVVMMLSELLDNATRYSPPHTSVLVTVDRVHNGLAFEIADSGMGMDADKVTSAETILSSDGLQGLMNIGERSQFGFLVVGKCASRLGARVQLTKSARGGVLALVLIPNEHLTTAPEETAESAPQTLTRETAAAERSENQLVEGVTNNGLPKRRRTAQTTTASTPAEAAPDSEAAQRRRAVMASAQQRRHRLSTAPQES